MRASILFTENLRLLRMGARRIINQGGQWSGKTINILGALCTLCVEEEGVDSGVTTVTSMSMPHLKGGAIRDFEMYVYPYFKNQIRKYHQTDHKITFNSGSVIEFRVFEDEMAARGHKRKRLFVNEANRFTLMHFFEMDSRSEQTVIDYNPSLYFWAHSEYIGKAGNELLISDHRHNPFLTKQKHDEIEGYYKPEEKDGGERFKVYSRGLTGNITGVIFPDWEMIDEDLFPIDQDWFFGIDFGYTNDPTAIVKMCRIADTLFVKELCYEPGLSDKAIKELLKANNFNFEETVLYCEHDADMIRELRNVGIYKALPARKGQGSIKAGIELLNQFKVKYSHNSTNLHRDRSLYVWETDKVTGKSTNTPVDYNNHLFDAMRYGCYTKYLQQSI